MGVDLGHLAMLPQLLASPPAWWLQAGPQGLLFPGRDPLLPITTLQAHLEAAKLGTPVTPMPFGANQSRPARTRTTRIIKRTPTALMPPCPKPYP